MMNDSLQIHLQEGRENAVAEYHRRQSPHVFFSTYTVVLQDILAALWADLLVEQTDLALLAIGGFGRGEVYPYSDLDLVAVSPEPLNTEQQTAVSVLVQTLWDIGLTPAIKSGSTAQLCAAAAEDLTTDTAFLEARFLCGNWETAQNFINETVRRRDMVSFIEGKLLEMRQRHARQGALMLEPDVKNGAGGLRDVHTMMWLAKAQGLSADFHDMVRQNIITRTEAGLLIYCHKHLARTRIDLHLAAERAQESLRFDMQLVLSEGKGDNISKSQACERLMAQFYRAVKTVLQLNGILIPMLVGRVYSSLPRITADIDADYYMVGNRIAVRDLALFHKSPEHIFKIIQMEQERREVSDMAPKTLRAWWTASQSIGKSFYAERENRMRFLGFFKNATHLPTLLRRLNLYGVLGRYLPAWKAIVGLLQHDLFHIYPVDDHILTVLDNVQRLALEEHGHELPFASALMRGFEPKYVLYLAALFHDVAKGRGGDHAILGVEDARQFAHDHEMPVVHAELLMWLVENHLLMSQTAQKTDFSDTEVLEVFCQKIQTVQRLTALYLLTVADIRGTNPQIWNSWKAQLLERLYREASRYLSGEVIIDVDSVVLSKLGFDAKVYRKIRSALGEAYFARHDINEILWHLPLLVGVLDKPAVHMRLLEDGETLQVLVFMPDGERLFTRLCRIFSKNSLDIAAARAYVTEHGYILDTFVMRLPEYACKEDVGRVKKALRRDLEDFVIRGRYRTRKINNKPGRRGREMPIPPRIVLLPSSTHKGWYTLEVIAVNRPCLLADITEVFAAYDVSLRHAKISTMTDRAEDSFVIFCPALSDPIKAWAFQCAVKEILA